MLDIFKDTSSDDFNSYPELFWSDQVTTWSYHCEKETFEWNMKSWQHAIQTS